IIPPWAFAPSLALLWLGAFLIQFMVQGAWGVIPAHISELSPDSVRGFLPGFAYQCGALIAGTAPTAQAWLATRYHGHGIGYANAMALTALVVFCGAAAVAGLGWERHAVGFGESSTGLDRH